MQTETVLVVVPDLIFRAKVTGAVRFAERTAVTATTSVAALEIAGSARPGIVVVDLGDERVAPFDTIRSLKADPATRGARVVGFYSHVDTVVRERAENAGCDDVIPRSAFVKRFPKILAETRPSSDSA